MTIARTPASPTAALTASNISVEPAAVIVPNGGLA